MQVGPWKGIGVCLLIFVFFFALLLYSGVRRSLSSNIIKKECQPLDVRYSSFDPYCVNMVQSSYLLYQKCEIWIMQKSFGLNDGYGFWLPVQSMYCFSSFSSHWTKQGVRIKFKDGFESFVPSEMFTRGR